MIVWTLAGSDSGGGAGIQTDLHTFQDFGVHGCSVITAITAQNSQCVSDVYPVPAEQVAAQIAALNGDLPAAAVKFGMLGSVETIAVIMRFLTTFAGKVVIDPVMIATSGKPLLALNQATYLSCLRQLLPFVDLLTPNLAEAAVLVGYPLHSYQDMERAAGDILSLGVKSVLIKGGHVENDKFCRDYWSNGVDAFWMSTVRQAQYEYLGTGCTLSSAITACLALGYTIQDALVIGKMYITQGIRLAEKIGQGLAILKHAGWPENEIDLPQVAAVAEAEKVTFLDCGASPLGLYPVVDSYEWLQKLLPLGVPTIQLRIKNKTGSLLENEIKQAVTLAKQYPVKLFINDYWELAIKHGAYGVHLGQEDLNVADCQKIAAAGLRLGISTHSYYEVARAHALKPSYIACGPIYPTTSKIMAFLPQGLQQLRRWQRTLTSYPLVAIGGINEARFIDVLATNVSGIAMISAITEADDPLAVTEKLLGYQ
jgi:hydroxymethylpyrimidine kinase/phosphomethylpyrimidine kinase/thiamine-phosphate diphosphorylase